MLKIAELSWSGLWRILPDKLRLTLSNRLLLARARARIPIPLSHAVVFSRDKSHRKRFTAFLHAPFDQDFEVQRSELPTYSLLITVRNEQDSISTLLDSILKQSVQPAQVVICDGGSQDQTLAQIEQWGKQHSSKNWQLELIKETGASIAKGRNLAAAKATSDLFLFTDAGAELAADWAENLLLPFTLLPETEVSMGWYQPICRTPFQAAIAEFIVPNIDAIDPRSFLPSARSLALRAEGFFAVGGYPEHLSKAGEDSLFDFYLKTVVQHVAFCPDAISKWQMPQSFFALARTIRGYARGDAEGGVLFWQYYLSLLGGLAGPIVELLLACGLGLLALLCHSSLLFLLALLFSLSGMYRLFEFFSGYGLASQNVQWPWRLLAIVTLTSNQALGFLSGYLARPEVEGRRIGSAKKGHILLFLPMPFVHGRDTKQTVLIETLLNDSWYVSAVTSDAPELEEGHVFAHPHFESHIRSQFRFEDWQEKHRSWLSSKSREFLYLDLSQDGLSAELVAKCEKNGAKPYRLAV